MKEIFWKCGVEGGKTGEIYLLALLNPNIITNN